MNRVDETLHLLHNEAHLGTVRAGALEVHAVCTEAFFWYGLRHVRASGVTLDGRTLPRPRRNLLALIVR